VDGDVFADPLVVVGEKPLPQDLDGDGRFEDVDGDGALSRGGDASALAGVVDAYLDGDLSLTQARIDALDSDGDGRLTGADNGASNRTRRG
jgi:hypothetical protein